ncbi:MAG: Metalloprotease MEP2 [uncultured Aureispira sp.]|uniref:Metalloprotease MEP2 n=1 Tax=uncultured Aureispira sp. TaxID=1331704 RepID=A0A6S6U226_9BACT|nr:MAG: Metalloprotease MEP2 [uncultured Aureispira sp.]
MKQLAFTILGLLLGTVTLLGQNPSTVIQQFLDKNYAEQQLTQQDISHWSITSHHTSNTSGVTHVYIQQEHEGIPVSNGLANFALKDGKIVSMGNRLVTKLSQKATYTTPAVNPVQAIQAAAKQLNLNTAVGLKALEPISKQHFIYNTGGISKENIPVRLMYHAVSEMEVKLVWDLSIYTLDANHWWSVRIDAQTGDLIDQNDWVVHCTFEHTPFTTCDNKKHQSVLTTPTDFLAPETMLQPDQYTVFALPLESPNHGTRSMVVNPADTLASPYGWHDTNGNNGAEYTITRGNNVFAYEDTANLNTPGFSPDGTALLEFNFPYNGNANPYTYQPAAITNLFYMNNMMHDIWYRYGFDEASGNFQANNYGRGGVDDDYVFAEAQDGGGTNNANFATPPDGGNPRMQMYLWNSAGGAGGNFLDVNSPVGIAGPYNAADAGFGPGLPTTPITADLVLIEDNTAPINDGCETLTNTAALAGKIVVIDRGSCSFVIKVEAAQNAGAVAVIIVNNVTGAPFQMGGTSTTITIPSIMIEMGDGTSIKAQMATGTVNATISNGGVTSVALDGDLDNGIVAHEYGHGISTRLTGGPNNGNCLSNSEQMGEGWSDWFGLMLTIEPGDLGPDVRGIGTYASSQAITGQGIRPAPYSTDFAVNPFTYDDSNNDAQISEPHGVGFIFATVLWDLTWALVDQYGGVPNPDLYNGTGGNNIAMSLVIEGLKLQPCNPGMIDGRDAILLADQLMYNGIHQCLIWEVFANRGFGYSASQGSSTSRTDQTEAFDLPPICQTPTTPPVALFSPNVSNSCITTISFTDNSTDIPQSWAWDFGDGTLSTVQNPTHTYNVSGVYTVKLVVANAVGSDSTTQQVTITLPPAPIADDIYVCAGDTAYVPAMATGIAQWKNIANNIVYIGDTLTVPNVGSIQTYYVENAVGTPSQYVGPASGAIGAGGYHASAYHGALNFTANQSFEIVSAWVDADGAGPRTFYLASGPNNDGAAPSGTGIVDQVTVTLVDGIQRIHLGLMVPAAGNYNIGGNNVNLFRNSGGANYPYTLGGYMTIDNSSATTNPTGYYYYLYDLELREPQCISALDTVTITPVVSNFSYVDNNGTLTLTDASNGATSWFWDFGDNNTSTQQNPVHTYSTSGSYTVTLTINNGACSSTQTFSVILGLNQVAASRLNIMLLPNPTDGLASILLDKAAEEDLTVLITDISGKTIQTTVLHNGSSRLELDLSQLPAAVYLVQIKGNNFSEVRKLLVE